MVARLRALPARTLPQGWRDALRQVSLFAAAYALYTIVRGLVEGDPGRVAFMHSSELISIERGMHVFVEPSVQAWASGSHLLMLLSSWLYVNAQTTIMFSALIYLYVRHNGSFYFVRNMFMIAMALALVGYAAFPTAPPRFMPEWGFSETVGGLTGVHISHESALSMSLFNPYAAVPSMHVACALMISWPLARLTRARPASLAFALYPFLITFVIVATANHFIIDAVLGAFTAALSAWGATRLARVGPARWSFQWPAPRAAAVRDGESAPAPGAGSVPAG
jgi:hypothetical protein